MTFEKFTTRDHAGAVRTVTLLLSSSGPKWVKGYAVNQFGERSDKFHIIATSTITRRRVMILDPKYGALKEQPNCRHCGEPLENLGSVERSHWVHVSDNPRAPIGSAQCVGDHWGKVAAPRVVRPR